MLEARAVDEAHDQTDPPALPVVVREQRVPGHPNHPARHWGQTLAVDAEQPSGRPTVLHALLTLPLAGGVVRIALADGDTDLASVTAPYARSLAAALNRLADAVEGLVI